MPQMTNLQLAWFYANLCRDLGNNVPASTMAAHRTNAIDHVACAGSEHFDPGATREGIAQVLREAGAIN